MPPSNARTGIFRATEGLVGALLLRSDLSLSFAAEASWVSELQLLAYDRERGGGLAGGIRRAWHQPDAADSEGAALIARILSEESQGRDARKIRAGLMLLNAGARRSTLPGAYDVVHSMRTPLPAGSRVSARIRALTVHDVIPLLHPEWMYQGAEPEVRAIMSSIDVERDFVIADPEATADDVAQPACRANGYSSPRSPPPRMSFTPGSRPAESTRSGPDTASLGDCTCRVSAPRAPQEPSPPDSCLLPAGGPGEALDLHLVLGTDRVEGGRPVRDAGAAA